VEVSWLMSLSQPKRKRTIIINYIPYILVSFHSYHSFHSSLVPLNLSSYKIGTSSSGKKK
jgi:hypothetical protein